jgi:3-oxoacyl-[acyl-carrier-protein] synthase-3
MSDEHPFHGRSPLRSLPGIRVLATGSYVPDQVVTNESLVPLGFDPEWIVQRTGIRERRHAPEGVFTSDMAYAAARRCIDAAGVSPRDIDLILLGTFTADMPMPATACRVQDRLGIAATAFDVQAACAGFMYALVTGAQFVASGTSQLALVIGADLNSRTITPENKKVFPLFGDGAGAVLLTKGNPDEGLLAYTLGSDGSGCELLCRPMGGSRIPPSVEALAEGKQYLYMDGRPVFRWAVRLIAQTVADVLAHANLRREDVDLFVLHQANRRIIDAAADAMGLPREKVAINLDRYGNTSGGSIPLTLDEAVRSGQIRRGSHVVLCGFGAGLAWGTAVLRW